MPLGVSRYSACVLVIFSDAREDRSQSVDETPPATAPIACRLDQQLRCSTMRPSLGFFSLSSLWQRNHPPSCSRPDRGRISVSFRQCCASDRLNNCSPSPIAACCENCCESRVRAFSPHSAAQEQNCARRV